MPYYIGDLERDRNLGNYPCGEPDLPGELDSLQSALSEQGTSDILGGS